MNKRSLGTQKEDLACAFLEVKGVHILEKNYRNRQGEIDLIGREKDVLVFFEVKYRRGNKNGYPEEAVSIYKQRKICRVADYYRMLHGISDFSPLRYDVIAIEGEKIRWIKNAFVHIF